MAAPLRYQALDLITPLKLIPSNIDHGKLPASAVQSTHLQKRSDIPRHRNAINNAARRQQRMHEKEAEELAALPTYPLTEDELNGKFRDKYQKHSVSHQRSQRDDTKGLQTAKLNKWTLRHYNVAAKHRPSLERDLQYYRNREVNGRTAVIRAKAARTKVFYEGLVNSLPAEEGQGGDASASSVYGQHQASSPDHASSSGNDQTPTFHQFL